jgi:hypothetical protein
MGAFPMNGRFSTMISTGVNGIKEADIPNLRYILGEFNIYPSNHVTKRPILERPFVRSDIVR